MSERTFPGTRWCAIVTWQRRVVLVFQAWPAGDHLEVVDVETGEVIAIIPGGADGDRRWAAFPVARVVQDVLWIAFQHGRRAALWRSDDRAIVWLSPLEVASQRPVALRGRDRALAYMTAGGVEEAPTGRVVAPYRPTGLWGWFEDRWVLFDELLHAEHALARRYPDLLVTDVLDDHGGVAIGQRRVDPAMALVAVGLKDREVAFEGISYEPRIIAGPDGRPWAAAGGDRGVRVVAGPFPPLTVTKPDPQPDPPRIRPTRLTITTPFPALSLDGTWRVVAKLTPADADVRGAQIEWLLDGQVVVRNPASDLDLTFRELRPGTYRIGAALVVDGVTRDATAQPRILTVAETVGPDGPSYDGLIADELPSYVTRYRAVHGREPGPRDGAAWVWQRCVERQTRAAVLAGIGEVTA